MAIPLRIEFAGAHYLSKLDQPIFQSSDDIYPLVKKGQDEQERGLAIKHASLSLGIGRYSQSHSRLVSGLAIQQDSFIHG